MKETPILFSTEMVKAILEGIKTQTRRIVKPQSGILTDELARSLNVRPPKEQNTPVIKCHYGKIGDVLWVRETFMPVTSFCEERVESGYAYKATDVDWGEYAKWKPSIFMPKEAARIWLRITNICVERLQDISEEDAIAEGVERCSHYPKIDGWKYYGKEKGWYLGSAISSFKSLWQSINGEQSWNDNPYVWVVEFEQIKNK